MTRRRRHRGTSGEGAQRPDQRANATARSSCDAHEGHPAQGSHQKAGHSQSASSTRPKPPRPKAAHPHRPGQAKQAHAGRPGSRTGGRGPRPPALKAPNLPHKSSITSHHGCDHVFFIGFLGAGKTTVARNLGNMFHRSFIDVDRMVERELHASVTRIFQTRGEAAFRDAETEALKTLGERRSLLVSCGGGVIERPENIKIMRQLGKVVYLDGTLEDSLRQIRRPDKRPDLGDREHARALYAHRRPLYEQACDLRVSISGKSFEQVAYEVGEMLWERGLL